MSCMVHRQFIVLLSPHRVAETWRGTYTSRGGGGGGRGVGGMERERGGDMQQTQTDIEINYDKRCNQRRDKKGWQIVRQVERLRQNRERQRQMDRPADWCEVRLQTLAVKQNITHAIVYFFPLIYVFLLVFTGQYFRIRITGYCCFRLVVHRVNLKQSIGSTWNREGGCCCDYSHFLLWCARTLSIWRYSLLGLCCTLTVIKKEKMKTIVSNYQ